MNEIKVFQTGRHYSEKGQRIAYIVDEYKIYFVDVDRGIDGVMLNPLAEIDHNMFDCHTILRMYDAGGYGDYEPDEIPIRTALRDAALHF